MTRGNIYIIFTNYDFLYLSLVHSMWRSRQVLRDQEKQYQTFYNPFWQNYSLESVSHTLSGIAGTQGDLRLNASYRKKLIEDRCALEADMTSADLVWVFTAISQTAIQQLKNWLQRSPGLSGYAVKPVLLAQRQDSAIWQSARIGWKNHGLKEVAGIYCKPGSFSRYAGTCDVLAEHFGRENCRLIAYEHSMDAENVHARIRAELESAIGVRAGSLAEFPTQLMPRSYVGLDLYSATLDFPFSKGETPLHDRNGFYAMLREVEAGEGCVLCPDAPPPLACGALAEFAEENRRLGLLAGHRLFGDEIPEGHVLPEPLPLAAPGDLAPFVKAMPAGLRHDLMRHFRHASGKLTPEQTSLARALEEYRRLFMPGSKFVWPRKQPVLSVLTMTRNHRAYLQECMETVAAQKTMFPVEHILVDDASDDGTQDILDDFASAHSHVRPIYLTTRSTGGENIRALFEACKSPYAALCDGDDYFTHPGKLQRQFDFLQKNTDCSICFHQVSVEFEDDGHTPFIFPPAHILPRGKREKYSLGDLIRGNFLQTNSVVYRWRFQGGLPDWFRSDLCPSDWYWHLLHAETGKIGFIPQVMAVYRRHGASYYKDAFISSRELRREHGLAELETYQAIDLHFGRRYFRPLAALANSVFVDFLEIMNRDGDPALLDLAAARYPDFARFFLNDLKIIHCRNPAVKPGAFSQ